jgi:hypothetical protein
MIGLGKPWIFSANGPWGERARPHRPPARRERPGAAWLDRCGDFREPPDGNRYAR